MFFVSITKKKYNPWFAVELKLKNYLKKELIWSWIIFVITK